MFIESLYNTYIPADERANYSLRFEVYKESLLQELSPITAHDTAGSFLLLGSSNGSINYIDMQKFPLRMKDNDLLVTELYR